MIRHRVILFLFPLIAVAASAQEARHADHEELRAMLVTATNALNTRNFAALEPMFDPNCYVTTADGKSFRGLAAFKAYLDGLYASKIKSITFHPVADALTTFYGADSGVCAGSSTDIYTFNDGDSRTMTSRWTATVYRDGGHWKVAALHMSTSFLANPAIDATRRYACMIAIAALIAGLILGYVIRMMVKRA